MVTGPTSNVYLLRQIEYVLRATSQYSLSAISLDNENFSESDADLLAGQEANLLAASWDNGLPVQVDHGVDPYILPPDSQMTSMLNVFFTDINWTWGCVHELTFRDTFSLARENGFKHVRRSWLGLLNIILAMVSRRNTINTDSENVVRDDSGLYFSRALVLITRTIFRGPNLETGKEPQGLVTHSSY